LLQRSLTALVGIPVLAAAIWVGAPWLTVMVLVAGLIGIWELYRLTPVGVGPLPFILGAAWVASFVLGAQAASGRDNYLIISGGVAAAGSFAALLWFTAFYRGNIPAGSCYLVGGPLYVGFLLAHALMLREITGGGPESGSSPDAVSVMSFHLGRSWLLFAILVTFATDTGAYLVGRTVGRHPMAPVISPNKTWEGSLGGFAAAVGAALLLGLVFDLGIPAWQQVVIGAVVGVVTQLGDLLESKLKRIAAVKDAGSIIPGHGGLLDRLDSILFAIPAVYYLVAIVFVP